jgi:hypothetical protein
MVQFFRQLDAPARKSQEGVWAELLVIEQAAAPEMLIRAWHIHPEDRYDFSAGTQRIEVKAATGGSRVHHFSLAQLDKENAKTCVASVMVERSAGGLSIADMVDRIAGMKSLTAEDVLGLRRTVGEVLGRDWLRGAREAFDHDLAVRHMRFVDAAAIPSIGSSCIPAEVTDVSFRCDISLVPGLDKAHLVGAGGLWSAATPR